MPLHPGDALARGAGRVPGSQEVLRLDGSRWGYRARRGWARSWKCVLGGWDPERLLSPALSDGDVLAEVRALPGSGPLATAQLQPLLGRPRPLVLDGRLASAVGDVPPYAVIGRWAGTGAWLSATAGRPRSWAPSR